MHGEVGSQRDLLGPLCLLGIYAQPHYWLDMRAVAALQCPLCKTDRVGNPPKNCNKITALMEQ